MISRRNVIKTGAVGIALAALPLEGVRQAFGQSVSAFDYYISPTGDDHNSGSLSSPWSITALNANRATYAGKRVGFLPGTYRHGTVGGTQTTLYSLYQALSSSTYSALALEGGTSGSPTYFGSSDSSGNYSPRTATIDFSDPSTSNLPTTEGSGLGQYNYMGANVSQYGNVTWDGINIKNFTFAALVFQAPSGNSIANSEVKNCEIAYGQNVISNNNPGAIWLEYPNGFVVSNCLIHDLKSNASGTSYTMQAVGVIQFNQTGTKTTITKCTFYNGCAISNKDNWQQMDITYCYIGYGAFGTPSGTNIGGTVHNYLTASGTTVNFDHNIVIGTVLGWSESGGKANEGTVNITNNTFYQPPGATYGHMAAFYGFGSADPTGLWNFKNNLVWSSGRNSPIYEDGDNFPACLVFQSESGTGGAAALGTCNYNCYGSNGNGVTFGTDWTSGDFPWSLSTWQGKGWDRNSTAITSTPFTSTPAEANYTSFAITGAAAAAGEGGVPCGAVDGSGHVGCDFAGPPEPSAPTLSVG